MLIKSSCKWVYDFVKQFVATLVCLECCFKRTKKLVLPVWTNRGLLGLLVSVTEAGVVFSSTELSKVPKITLKVRLILEALVYLNNQFCVPQIHTMVM